MTTITRRTALAAIPAMAAVTALPALAGATDTDAGLIADVKEYYRVDPIHTDALRERELAEHHGRPCLGLKRREDALYDVLDTLLGRIYGTPAQTVHGALARLKFSFAARELEDLRAGRPLDEWTCDVRGEIGCALWRDLDRLARGGAS